MGRGLPLNCAYFVVKLTQTKLRSERTQLCHFIPRSACVGLTLMRRSMSLLAKSPSGFEQKNSRNQPDVLGK